MNMKPYYKVSRPTGQARFSVSGSSCRLCLVSGVRLTVGEARLTAVMPHIKFINALDLLLLNYSNASISLPQVLIDHDLDFLAVTLIITTGLCLTAFASRIWSEPLI